MSSMPLLCALFLAVGHFAFSCGLDETIEGLHAAGAVRTCIFVRRSTTVQDIPLWSLSQLILLEKEAIKDLEQLILDKDLLTGSPN
jgi:hypothetical protein